VPLRSPRWCPLSPQPFSPRRRWRMETLVARPAARFRRSKSPTGRSRRLHLYRTRERSTRSTSSPTVPRARRSPRPLRVTATTTGDAGSRPGVRHHESADERRSGRGGGLLARRYRSPVRLPAHRGLSFVSRAGRQRRSRISSIGLRSMPGTSQSFAGEPTGMSTNRRSFGGRSRSGAGSPSARACASGVGRRARARTSASRWTRRRSRRSARSSSCRRATSRLEYAAGVGERIRWQPVGRPAPLVPVRVAKNSFQIEGSSRSLAVRAEAFSVACLKRLRVHESKSAAFRTVPRRSAWIQGPERR